MLSKKEIIALNQTEYQLRVTVKAEGHGISQEFIVINEYNELQLVSYYELDKLPYDTIKSMTRSEWNQIMPRIKRFLESHWHTRNKKCTLKLEKAFSYNDVITVYFVPSKQPGMLTLTQLKKELKSLRIPIAAIEQDIKVHKYGSPEKYYRVFVLKQYKSKLDQYIKSAKDYGNIGYDPLSY